MSEYGNSKQKPTTTTHPNHSSNNISCKSEPKFVLLCCCNSAEAKQVDWIWSTKLGPFIPMASAGSAFYWTKDTATLVTSIWCNARWLCFLELFWVHEAKVQGNQVAITYRFYRRITNIHFYIIICLSELQIWSTSERLYRWCSF